MDRIYFGDELAKVAGNRARSTMRQRQAEARLRNAVLKYFRGLRARVVEEAKSAKLVKFANDPYIRLIGKDGDVEIWSVNGAWVRKNRYTDFVMDGHDKVYPEFIPPNQIWIDNAFDPNEESFIIQHAVIERRKMAEGMSYDDAHEWATELEARARQLEDA